MNGKEAEVKIELHGFLAEFRQALEDEITKIKKSGQSSTLLFDGHPLEGGGAEFRYFFRVEYMPTLPADTPCKLKIGKDQYDVTVISCSEEGLVLSCNQSLPPALGRAQLENGATVLMERLIRCIEENAEKDNPAGKKMMPQASGAPAAFCTYPDCPPLEMLPKNNEEQNKAIQAALSNDITYIWGPPGTGKTTVIGQIINNLYKTGHSVLVVSHTNTAVDGAIQRAIKSVGDTDPYPILRLGIPVKQLDERVKLESHVASLGKDLYAKKEALERERDEIRSRLNAVILQLAKLQWISESQLERLGPEIARLERLEAEGLALKKQHEAAKTELEMAKAAHPEYVRLSSLKHTLSRKNAEKEELLRKINLIDDQLHSLPAEIQQAQDEARKHELHQSLRADGSKRMSEVFLRQEITKAQQSMRALHGEAASLDEEKWTLESRIQEYEKKSGVAKFFAGKAKITEAQQRLSVIQMRLPQIRDDMQGQTRLEEEYQRQLDELRLLKAQIAALSPTKSRQYWEQRALELSGQLEKAQHSSPELATQLNSLDAEIQPLRADIQIIELASAEVQEIAIRAERTLVALQEKRSAYRYQKNRCIESLKAECNRCPVFFDGITAGEAKTYERLCELLEQVTPDVKGLDPATLSEEKRSLENALPPIFSKLDEIQQQMQELERQAILQAKIVGATLAKSYLSKTLRERSFDTVILDEASMASVPALWCAAYLAEKSIVIVGDFLQLPPIVMADTEMAKKWLGTDIFYISGMQELAKRENIAPANFVMLNQQFRMESAIADIANQYYSLYCPLRSDDQNDFRKSERAAFFGWYNGADKEHSVELIDTESLHAWVTGIPQGKRHSRLNCFSAAIDVSLAFKCIEKKLAAVPPDGAKAETVPSVLIIAPYRPHIKLIEKQIDIAYKSLGFKDNLGHIRAGTIHSFQGNEADIVIFDLVIDEPHWKANLFMPDSEINNDLRKMFNVAVTRAKFKLFVVGDFAYCRSRAKDNALSQLLEKIDVFPKQDAKTLFPDLTYAPRSGYEGPALAADSHVICRENEFEGYFEEDIRTFQRRMIIYSPFMTENRLSRLLPLFKDAISANKRIIVITKAPSDFGKRELAIREKCERALHDMGVKVVHKKGMHEKLIIIDGDAIWQGSLNALSFTGQTGEVMERRHSPSLVKEYEKMFGIDPIFEAVEREDEAQCPICGGEMILGEGDSGGVYWSCENKDYARGIDQPYPHDGILRCKCGAPFRFVMKNQPRWVCTQNPDHYQIMRKSDIKLEKMAALIPTKKDIRAVEHYFAEKSKTAEAKKSKGPSKPSKKKTEKPNRPKDFEQMNLF